MRSMIDVVWNRTKAGGFALAAAAALTLAGCGGGDSVVAGGGTNVTGQFVDAPVAGLGYKCGASATLGTTDSNGLYTCKAGESVGFYVGDILLGSVASAQAVVTPLDLVGPGAKPTDLAVSNIVRFLLSISTADAAGNLVIDPNAGTNAKGKTVDFKTVASSALDAMITTVKPGATPVTKTAAENHMQDSIYKLFAKNYTGSYSGSLSGTWSLLISATDGSVTGIYTDSVNGAGAISGQMSSDLNVSSTYNFTGTAGSATWTGTLNVSTGVFSGTWDSGTFTGKAGAAPAGGGTLTASGLAPATGAAGSAVTITGTNLNAVTQVLFTGPSPSFSFVEGVTTAKTVSSITATVPAALAAGSYTITVVHAGGEVTVGAFTVSGTSGGGGEVTTCISSHYSVPVHAPTATEFAAYAKTYSGNVGNFGPNIGDSFVSTGSASFVLSAEGGLSYNGATKLVTSMCLENTPTTSAPLYIEMQPSDHVDFFTDGGFTGALTNGADFNVVRGGSCTTTCGSGGGTTTPTIPSAEARGLTLSPAFNGLTTFANSVPFNNGGTGFVYSQGVGVPNVTVNYLAAVNSGSENITISVEPDFSGATAYLDQGTGFAAQMCILTATSGVSAPVCSTVGVTFNRATGTVSFVNTPMKSIFGSTTTTFALNGSLTFTPF